MTSDPVAHMKFNLKLQLGGFKIGAFIKQAGLYYEGYVEDIDLIRQQHQADTVSTFGVRRSRCSAPSSGHGKTPDIGDEDKVHYILCDSVV